MSQDYSIRFVVPTLRWKGFQYGQQFQPVGWRLWGYKNQTAQPDLEWFKSVAEKERPPAPKVTPAPPPPPTGAPAAAGDDLHQLATSMQRIEAAVNSLRTETEELRRQAAVHVPRVATQPITARLLVPVPAAGPTVGLSSVGALYMQRQGAAIAASDTVPESYLAGAAPASPFLMAPVPLSTSAISQADLLSGAMSGAGGVGVVPQANALSLPPFVAGGGGGQALATGGPIVFRPIRAESPSEAMGAPHPLGAAAATALPQAPVSWSLRAPWTQPVVQAPSEPITTFSFGAAPSAQASPPPAASASRGGTGTSGSLRSQLRVLLKDVGKLLGKSEQTEQARASSHGGVRAWAASSSLAASSTASAPSSVSSGLQGHGGVRRGKDAEAVAALRRLVGHMVQSGDFGGDHGRFPPPLLSSLWPSLSEAAAGKRASREHQESNHFSSWRHVVLVPCSTGSWEHQLMAPVP